MCIPPFLVLSFTNPPEFFTRQAFRHNSQATAGIPGGKLAGACFVALIHRRFYCLESVLMGRIPRFFTEILQYMCRERGVDPVVDFRQGEMIGKPPKYSGMAVS